LSKADVLVIGAGQAGLAASYRLSRRGISPRVVDAAERIGDQWRSRYRSLTLFTPREFSSLPGLALSGDGAGYASGAEFADYLERYAVTLGLPVTTGARVGELSGGRGEFVARLSNGDIIEAGMVIIATGGFQTPVVPAMAAGLPNTIRQLTGETYHQPSDVDSDRPALVVGDGASGRDIAADLAASNHQVALACGRARRLLPETILGKSTWKWLKALGLLSVSATSPVGRLMRKADPFPNRQRNLEDLRGLGVEIKPRAVSASRTGIELADGSIVEPGTVIWTLGYRDDTSWVRIPSAVQGGRFLDTGGRSPIDGLYFVGRPWQRNRTSALIMGAGDDAETISREIAMCLNNGRSGP
jgi:putative flavoprotein involved in K+ transport